MYMFKQTLFTLSRLTSVDNLDKRKKIVNK